MSDNKFFEVFNDIDDKYIEEAQLPADGPDMYVEYGPRKISKRTAVLSAVGALAACAALVFGIAKLPALLNGITTSEGESGQNSSAESVGDAYISYMLHGTPLSFDELEEFTVEEAVSDYRQTFSDELNAVLDSIGRPEITEAYRRARTLAELVRQNDDARLIATDKIKAKEDRAYVSITIPTTDAGFPDSVVTMYETGYSYDSFCRAFREAFGEASADNMIMRSRSVFRNVEGQLYASDEYYSNEDTVYGLVHTDYEVIANNDMEVVFNTVCYYDYADEWLKKEVREPYDPANRDTYLNKEGKRFIGTEINRIVNANGVWEADDICYGANFNTLERTFENRRPDITDKYGLDGEPFPASDHTEFEYGDIPVEFVDELKKDEALTSLLESLGDSEFTEFYYKARTLAETLALNDRSLLERSPCMGTSVGAGISFYDKYNQVCDRYLELGYKYDSFLETLHEIFGDETVDYMLEHGTYYDYNNELYYACFGFKENPLLVHSDYRLVSHTDDEIVFDTICYHIRPEDYEPYANNYSYRQAYEPNGNHKYILTAVTNRFVKEDGKWKAEKLCFLGDLSSVGEIESLEHVPDSYDIEGTPLSESELADFDYEELLNVCREKLEKDEGLTALLSEISDPEFAERYYRARTLADMLTLSEGAELIPSEKIKNGHEAAVMNTHKLLSSFVSHECVYKETGYSYDSFERTMRDMFGEETFDTLVCDGDILAQRSWCELDGALWRRDISFERDYLFIHSDYELITVTDSEIVFDTICYNSRGEDYTPGKVYEFDPDNRDNYYAERITNRFVKTNGKWKAEKLCCGGNRSSVNEYKEAFPLPEEFITIDGESVRLVGMPKESAELAPFDYGRQYEERTPNRTALADFLERLDNPEAAEVYMKAAAVTDGFYAGEYMFEDAGNRARIENGDYVYIETGYTAESFAAALREMFTVEAAQTIPANTGVFLSYNGELWQRDLRDDRERHTLVNYELVKNTDSEIEFKTLVFYTYDENVNFGAVGYSDWQTLEIKNRIVKTENGWRVDEMSLWNRISSKEAPIFSDLDFDVTGQVLQFIKDCADFYYEMVGGVTIDEDQPFDTADDFTAKYYYRVIEGPALTEAELDELLDGMLTDNLKSEFKKQIIEPYYMISPDGGLYHDYGFAPKPSEWFKDKFYLDSLKKDGDTITVTVKSYWQKEHWDVGSDFTSSEEIVLKNTENGLRIDQFSMWAVEYFGYYGEIICGPITAELNN